MPITDEVEAAFSLVEGALRTYSDATCPICGEFLPWDGISEHIIEEHTISDNIVLGEN